MSIAWRAAASAAMFSIVAIAGSATSPAGAQSPPMTLLKLADNVYAMQHPTGASNAMFAVTDEGVVVWDADIRSAPLVLAAIRRTTDKKVRYLIISHPAGDHATGGWTYREDRPVMIATKRQALALAEEELAQFKERQVDPEPRFANYHGAQLVQPDVVFEGSLTLRFGGLTFVLTEEGAAHSVSDVTMYIPEKKVFGMGDLFRTESHSNPVTAGLIEQIRARHLDVTTYVPGHGPVHVGRGQADIDEMHLYFAAMRGQVASLMAQGKTDAQAAAEFKAPAPFDKYKGADALNRLVPNYYRSLKGEAARP